jgi:hypothetical protein
MNDETIAWILQNKKSKKMEKKLGRREYCDVPSGSY